MKLQKTEVIDFRFFISFLRKVKYLNIITIHLKFMLSLIVIYNQEYTFNCYFSYLI